MLIPLQFLLPIPLKIIPLPRAVAAHMSQYTKTQPRRQPKTPSSVTAEQRYWRSFKQPCVFTALNVVSRVRFCPADPRDLLITSGPRVHVYDPLQVHSHALGARVLMFL